MTSPFILKANFRPSGDQPSAIKSLLQGLKNKTKFQTLLGVTGSGKTFTMANVIAKNNKPIIRELCNDMSNPLYPIQIQRFMKNIFQKENTLVVAISKRLEILAKKFDMKNVWMRPNPIDENRFFVDYKKKI